MARGFAGGLAAGLATGYQLAEQSDRNRLLNEATGLEIASRRDEMEQRKRSKAIQDQIDEAGRTFMAQFTPSQALKDEEGQAIPGLESAQAPVDPYDMNTRYMGAQAARLRKANELGHAASVEAESKRLVDMRQLHTRNIADDAIRAYQGKDYERAAQLFGKAYGTIPDGADVEGHSLTGMDTDKPTAVFKVRKSDGSITERPVPLDKDSVVKMYAGLTSPEKTADFHYRDIANLLAARKEAREDRKADRDDRKADREDKKEERMQGVADAQTSALLSLASLRDAKAAGGGGSGGGSADPSKGAKFDVDKDGNRVILYRDGTMVYPKDADGNPVKFKSGTDQDQKFIRKIVENEQKKNPVASKDPVGTARDLAARTGSSPAPTPGLGDSAAPGAPKKTYKSLWSN